jgi:hypothetical protein
MAEEKDDKSNADSSNDAQSTLSIQQKLQIEDIKRLQRLPGRVFTCFDPIRDTPCLDIRVLFKPEFMQMMDQLRAAFPKMINKVQRVELFNASSKSMLIGVDDYWESMEKKKQLAWILRFPSLSNLAFIRGNCHGEVRKNLIIRLFYNVIVAYWSQERIDARFIENLASLFNIGQQIL